MTSAGWKVRDRLAVIALVAACTPAPVKPPIVATPPTSKPAGPPALFAELFKQGASWTFAGETVDVEGPDRKTEAGEVTCSIDGAVEIPHGWVAELTCTGMANIGRVNGTYVATAAGLWKIEATEIDNDITKLVPGEMLIAAEPRPIKRETHVMDVIDMMNMWSAAPQNDGWCISNDTSGGDEDGWSLCIQAGKGIIGGSGYFAGGFTHDTYFGDVPRH